MTDQELIVKALTFAALIQKDGIEAMDKGDTESAKEYFLSVGLVISELGLAMIKED